MLIIKRKPQETVTIICPDGTKIKLHNISKNSTNIGIEAPRHYRVTREDDNERPRRKY